MSLTPPSFPMFFIATVAGGVGIAARLGYIALSAPLSFALVAIAFLVLWIACLFRTL